MSENGYETETSRPKSGRVFWNVAIVVALCANAALFLNARHIAADAARSQDRSQEQIAKLTEQLSQSGEATQQSVDAVARQAQESAAAAAASAEQRARAELRKTNASLAAQLAQQRQQHEQVQQQVAGELSDLKEANNSATSRLSEISGDVSGVKSDVASTQSELQKTGSDLKRVMGDMGAMSGLIATNSSQLSALKELGERDYVEFRLQKSKTPQKVGDVQLALAKADPKRNRFTIQVLADDKKVEKRDRTINEPVQLYLAGNRQPNEIVVNEIKKDEIVGYLSMPKVKVARR